MKMDNKYFTIGSIAGGPRFTSDGPDILGFTWSNPGHFNGHTMTVNRRYQGYDYTYPGTFDGQNAWSGWTYREKVK